MTYWPPTLSMLPFSMALMPSRWQISRPTSLVMRSLGLRPMNCNVWRIFCSGKTFKYGDCQIDGQRLLQSAIEDRVGGGVYKIGNQDRIFFGERVAAFEKHEANACGGQCDDQRRDQPHGQLASGRRGSAERTGGSRGQNGARFGVAFEALQVGAHLGGALVAEVAVLFEQLVQDPFKRRRQVGVQAKRWGGRAIQDGVENDGGRISAEGHGTGGHLIEL